MRQKPFVVMLLFVLLFTQIMGSTAFVHAEDVERSEHTSEGEEVVEEPEIPQEEEEQPGESISDVEQAEEEEAPSDISEPEEENISEDADVHTLNVDEQDVQEAEQELEDPSLTEEITTTEIEDIEEPYIVLADFENGSDNWTVSGARHNHVDLSISNDVVRFGSSALKLEYDFTGTQGTSGIYASVDTIEIPGDPEKIGMWVYGDGHKHWLRQQLTDANGVNFNIDYTPGYPNGVTWEGWKYVEATLPTDWQAPYTMSSQAVRYMATSDDAKTAGTLYIDNIRAVYHDTDEDVTNPTLTDFYPAGGEISYVNTPEIAAIATDNQGGSGIDPERIFMTVNGEQVTPSYDAQTGLVAYEPTKQLAEGYHEAKIEVFDHAGNHFFHTWDFHVSTGGPSVDLNGPEKVYAGSTFDLQVTVDNVESLSGTGFRLTYDPTLVHIVRSEEEISDALADALVDHTVNEETGDITFSYEQLDELQLSGEEVLATLTFALDLDASGRVDIQLLDGVHTYADASIGEVPFFITPYRAAIGQPLTMDIEGKSVQTPSEITVVDQEGNPVEGAQINVLDDTKLIKVVQPTHIYKGGSGVAGEPYETLSVGDIIPVANVPYAGFDFYRIYLPNGEQRYYHVPMEDVEEIEWSSLFDVTDEHGKVHTELLTLSQIPVRLQASKGELVSQVMSFTILPQIGETTPENITLTWKNDPETTQHVTWRTNTSVTETVVEVIAASDAEGFESAHVNRFEGSNTLFSDDLGEMVLHYAEATGLTPGETYTYRVGDGTEAGWSETNTFTTASATVEDPFRFLFFTDTQAQDSKGFALWTDLYETSLEKFPDAKFALHAGDIVEEGNTLQQWEDFLFASEGLFNKIPFMSVLGNHDVYGDGANTYKALFPYPENGPEGKENFVYSFEYGNVNFIMLNSEFGIKDMEEQQEWLRQEVQHSDKLWNVAMFHRSPYKSNPKRGTDATVQTFAPILEELEVDLVLTGHDHAYMRSHPMQNGEPQPGGTGTIYMIGGSAGPKFYPGTAYEYVDALFDVETQLYTSLYVEGDEIKIEAYTVDNELVDSYTLKKAIQEEPTDPVDPTDPEEPVDPVDPIDPEEPTDPVDPADPVDPSEPTDPIDEEEEEIEKDTETEKEEETGTPPSGEEGDEQPQADKTAQDVDEDGNKLPSTATAFANWMFLGFLLLVAACITWQIGRRKHKVE